jgi:hypothetical protein
MSVCKECDYYALPADEKGNPRIINEVDGSLEKPDISIKAACFYNAPYPNCGKTGRMQRPIVFANEHACSKFRPGGQ